MVDIKRVNPKFNLRKVGSGCKLVHAVSQLATEMNWTQPPIFDVMLRSSSEHGKSIVSPAMKTFTDGLFSYKHLKDTSAALIVFFFVPGVKGFNRCVHVSVGQEPAQFHQVYPTVEQNIPDLDMSHHECSDSSSLVSILSTLKMADELVITQMRSALDCFQIQLAKCKVLTKQEEEVVAANFMRLFKVEPKVMAEALTKLDELSTSLVLLRSSSWPASAEFDIENILIQVKALAKQAMEASFKVWANALIKASCTCVDLPRVVDGLLLLSLFHSAC